LHRGILHWRETGSHWQLDLIQGKKISSRHCCKLQIFHREL
jgi:hypothetical protein